MFSLLIVPLLASVPSARPQTPPPPPAASERRAAMPGVEQRALELADRAPPDRSPPILRELAAEAASASNADQAKPPVQLPEVGVPFACNARFPVSQGHATGSHLSHDTYAWDFRMPEGTPITAARAGVVRLARGDSKLGGCDQKMAKHSNYVVLQHEGDLETQYLHFSSVVVKVGERVEQGQLIGYSGNTGWSCGPHLHFKVARRTGDGWNNPSLPAMLEGHGDPVRGTLVAAPTCEQQQPRQQYADLESGASGDVQVADVEVGASMPGGPLPTRPASALGGADRQGTIEQAGAKAKPASGGRATKKQR